MPSAPSGSLLMQEAQPVAAPKATQQSSTPHCVCAVLFGIELPAHVELQRQSFATLEPPLRFGFPLPLPCSSGSLGVSWCPRWFNMV